LGVETVKHRFELELVLECDEKGAKECDAAGIAEVLSDEIGGMGGIWVTDDEGNEFEFHMDILSCVEAKQ